MEIIHTSVEQWINTGHSVKCEYDPGHTRSGTGPPCALSPGFACTLSPALLPACLELSITSMVWEVGSRPPCAQLMLWALLAFMKFVIAPCLLNARKPQNMVFPQTLFAVPTFEVLSLALQHFFRKTPRDRKHNWKLPWFKGFLYIVFICSSCFISLLLCKVIYCSQAGRYRN